MKYALLFETLRPDRENRRDYFFTSPVDVIKAYSFGEVEEAFKKINSYAYDHYLAGYFSYELGYFFEKHSFNIRKKFSYPLIHLGVFKTACPIGQKDRIFGSGNTFFKINHTRFNYQEAEYCGKIRRIKGYIRDGDTYQVNFTGKYSFELSGSALSLYEALKKRQAVSYAAFCKMDDECIISLSPELFFRRSGQRIISRPMKGTIKRGRNLSEDKEAIYQLKSGVKNRAENLMIVDLMRNDLGRICVAGSVRTSRIFDIEKYNTLFQMTSTVTGRMRKNTTYFEIFRNIFPGGSVTGAPKIRTMQIIRELEKGDRGIYCGALGFISPGSKAVFNMPIRTISITNGNGQMGVGSGIVIDSDPKQEYRECILKADFLTRQHNSFKIIETMLWEGKYIFLSAHLKRLRECAEYFGFVCDLSVVTARLRRLEKSLKQGSRYRVRLLLDRNGKIGLNSSEIESSLARNGNFIAISRHRTDPDNLFLYHKTTNRALYDSQHKVYAAKGYLDVIFLNTRNEVTEGAISNIMIQKAGRLYTPVLDSGLLPGIFRQHLLDIGKAKEKKLTLIDLRKADKIFICNSVRGLVEVKLREG